MAESSVAEPVVAKKRSRKLLVAVLTVLVAAAIGGYLFNDAAKSAQAAEAAAEADTAEAHEGKTVRLAPITLNLSDGRILKVGLALELAYEPKNEELAYLAKAEEKPGKEAGAISVSPMGGLESVALNQAIMTLGEETFEQLSRPGGRTAAKEKLIAQIKTAYDGDVVKVYFTEFVMA